MKLKKRLIAYGSLVALLAFIYLAFLRPPAVLPPGARVPKEDGLSMSLVAYTNVSGTDMALFSISNRTKSTLVCWAGGGAVSELGHPFPTTNPPDCYMLPAHGTTNFTVAFLADTNVWRTSVSGEEFTLERAKWRRTAEWAFAAMGLRAFEPEVYHLTSPPFGRDVDPQ